MDTSEYSLRERERERGIVVTQEGSCPPPKKNKSLLLQVWCFFPSLKHQVVLRVGARPLAAGVPHDGGVVLPPQPLLGGGQAGVGLGHGAHGKGQGGLLVHVPGEGAVGSALIDPSDAP